MEALSIIGCRNKHWSLIILSNFDFIEWLSLNKLMFSSFQNVCTSVKLLSFEPYPSGTQPKNWRTSQKNPIKTNQHDQTSPLSISHDFLSHSQKRILLKKNKRYRKEKIRKLWTDFKMSSSFCCTLVLYFMYNIRSS